jgi:hypothetical protein
MAIAASVCSIAASIAGVVIAAGGRKRHAPARRNGKKRKKKRPGHRGKTDQLGTVHPPLLGRMPQQQPWRAFGVMPCIPAFYIAQEWPCGGTYSGGIHSMLSAGQLPTPAMQQLDRGAEFRVTKRGNASQRL